MFDCPRGGDGSREKAENANGEFEVEMGFVHNVMTEPGTDCVHLNPHRPTRHCSAR